MRMRTRNIMHIIKHHNTFVSFMMPLHISYVKFYMVSYLHILNRLFSILLSFSEVYMIYLFLISFALVTEYLTMAFCIKKKKLSTNILLKNCSHQSNLKIEFALRLQISRLVANNVSQMCIYQIVAFVCSSPKSHMQLFFLK